MTLRAAKVLHCLQRAGWPRFSAGQPNIQPSKQESEEKYGKQDLSWGRGSMSAVEKEGTEKEVATGYPLLGRTGL